MFLEVILARLDFPGANNCNLWNRFGAGQVLFLAPKLENGSE